MNSSLKHIIALVFILSTEILFSQNTNENLDVTLSFEEYLGYIKKHHPLMKQAQLTLSLGEANLLKARGGFDPKVEIDYARKKFKDIEYYDQLNATFKIPTWYGIELNVTFEESTGEFLNPNLNVPENGLYSAGVSFSLAQGFLINERMADIKKARFFREQTRADRDLLVNNLLFEASKAYFHWLEATYEQQIYQNSLLNADTRLTAVKRSAEVGEIATIDVTEARITLQTRQLNLEAAILKRRKAALVASNYLWLDAIPLELQEEVAPILPEQSIVESALLINGITDISLLVENHPKLQSLDSKIGGLTVDRRLKRNKLLPQLDLKYNFLSTENNQISTYNTANYKAALNFSFPLFLRKERGDLRLANLKLKDVSYERTVTALSLRTKIDAANAEISSLSTQNNLITEIVKDYQTMVAAEERKFFLGESSLFLINSREQKLIDAQLKENEINIKQLVSTANLYNALGLSESGTNLN